MEHVDDFLRDLERDLDDLAGDLISGPEVTAEFRQDRAAVMGEGVEDEAAARRHLEWFLLERESEAIGSVPVELAVELRTSTDELRALRYAALRSSRAGIFVVARVDPEEGLLLDELLGRGQYVVDERALAEELEPGDLLVGRIFPRDLPGAGEHTTWCLSSGAASLRNPELLEALQHDVEAMRQRARGPLRMTQAELEVMFFRERLELPLAPGGELAPAPTPVATREPLPLAEQLAETRARLLEGGLGEERWSELLQVLRARPMPAADLALGGDDPLGWILEELAFETDVDLDSTRALLAGLWQALHREPTAATPEAADEGPDVRAALARFDQGREAGVDVDSLFASLEAELGLDPDDEDDDHRVPDFPGVLGALVQEYLWDGARLTGHDLDAFVGESRELELLVRFGGFLGVAEELDLNHLRVFLGRWLWEQPEVLAGDRDLDNLGRSLTGFLTWLEEHHGHGLGDGLTELIQRFADSQARILAANRRLAEELARRGEQDRSGEPVSLCLSASGTWEDLSGDPVRPLDVPVGLRPGDRLVCLRAGSELYARLAVPPIDGPHIKATS